MVEHGIVKFFDGRDGKKFGFLAPCDLDGNMTGERDIFFHYNDYGTIDIVNLDVYLVRSQPDDPESPLPRYPRRGERLAFMRGPGRGRPKATNWVRTADFIAAVAEYDSLFDESDMAEWPEDADQEDCVLQLELAHRAYADSGSCELTREATRSLPSSSRPS